MSLDFYLIGDETETTCTCSDCYNEHTRREQPVLFHVNITHNLATMAEIAGIYACIWRPDEHTWTHAHHIITHLEKGLHLLTTKPEQFKKLNPTNDFGNYEILVKRAEEILGACKENPQAQIDVCR